VSLFAFFSFFAFFAFFSFLGADCIEESDAGAAASCAKIGMASDTHRAAANSKLNTFFMLGIPSREIEFHPLKGNITANRPRWLI
jgi:hypothetical protein